MTKRQRFLVRLHNLFQFLGLNQFWAPFRVPLNIYTSFGGALIYINYDSAGLVRFISRYCVINVKECSWALCFWLFSIWGRPDCCIWGSPLIPVPHLGGAMKRSKKSIIKLTREWSHGNGQKSLINVWSSIPGDMIEAADATIVVTQARSWSCTYSKTSNILVHVHEKRRTFFVWNVIGA